MSYKYLIIGNSAAGIGAAEAIRSVDAEGSLAILSDEPYVAYSRPMITRLLTGQASFNNMVYRSSSFYTENRIETLLGKKVAKLQPSENKVTLDSGEEIAYEKLLLATGGTPFIPKMNGLQKKGIHTFTTIKDAEEIRGKIEQQKISEVVVLGGGLIGLLTAEALVTLGLKVTVVELMDRVLGPLLDPKASAMVREVVERNGIQVITGHTVTEVLGKEEVTGVQLDDGRWLPCRLFVVAVGVAPNAGLAREAGLKVNRGIAVNARMETSAPNIYACGDCAEILDFLAGNYRSIPIWPAAYMSGMVAGSNMAESPKEYEGGVGMNSLHLFGFPVISFGKVNPADAEGCEVLSKTDEGRGVYRKIVLSGNRIVGAVLVEDIDRAGVLLGLMRRKVDVSGVKEALVQEDLGLVNLPKAVRSRMFEMSVKNNIAK